MITEKTGEPVVVAHATGTCIMGHFSWREVNKYLIATHREPRTAETSEVQFGE